jgi:hypothetical protein
MYTSREITNCSNSLRGISPICELGCLKNVLRARTMGAALARVQTVSPDFRAALVQPSAMLALSASL